MMKLLTHPSIFKYEVGSRDWFDAQKRMIKSKPLIKRCYDLWYSRLKQDAESVSGDGICVEIGSGASYIKEFLPGTLTTDVISGVADLVVDGRALPFGDHSVKALFLTHSFHHIPDIERFFHEAQRVLLPGGVISMVECAHTALGRFFFSRIHPEPYCPEVSDWDFSCNSNMKDSNQALSWIVFFRDRSKLHRLAPGLSLERWQYLPWFSYLMSGGVNLKNLVPSVAAPMFVFIDKLLTPFNRFGAIHWHLTIRKTDKIHE